jgi:hypothetical protein
MTLETVRARLGALVAAIDTLGPILELDREWRAPGGDVGRAKDVRAEIQEVLDRPRCAYDDAALELYRALAALPDRTEVRALVGEHERRAVVPGAIRAPWLALEERSAERLASGLVLLALALHDQDDYRDVMISLAPARVCAGELGLDAAAVFDEAAAFAGPGVADTFSGFGRRETGLGAFGWKRVETQNGPRFHLGL